MLRPITFQFKETPTAEDIDFSSIEYDSKLNLSVDKITKKPAIDSINLGTETFTRFNESSDSDYQNVKLMMDTETYTKVQNESTDSDFNRLGAMMGTSTATLDRNEVSDVD